MQKLGIKGTKFTIRYGVIARHFGKDGSHDFTIEEWQQLPNAIQNPFAITKYKNRGYRIYTALQTEKGEFIVVGVDVKNAGRELEINAISTVFGRRSNANLPENEEVIYVSETITPEQQSLLSRPNSDQYPAERESSTHKDTPSTPNSQAKKSKSNVAKKDKAITTSDLFPKVDNSKKLGKEISRQSAVTDKNVTLTRIDYENGYVCRVENKQGDFVEQAYNADGTPMSQALYNIGIDNNQFKDFVKQDADGLYIKDKHLFEVLVQNAEQQKDILPNEAAPLTEDEFEEALNTDDIDKVTDALKLTRNAIELNSIDDIQEGDIVLITHMNAELLKKGETGTYVYKARKKLSRSYDLESVLADGSISITNEDIESIKRTPGGSLTIYRVKPELADRLKRGEEEKQRKLREENLKFEEEMRKKAEASAKRREKARAQEKANEERAERIFDMAQEAENVEDFFKMASEIYQITKTEAILRGIFNLLKNHTINSSREVGHYLAPYSEFLTPNEEQEAKRSERTNAPAKENVPEVKGNVDNQGNPLNEDGTLKVEKINAIDELTDEDFSNPTRNVQLPALPQNVDNAIGANGKPVVIKKNIFKKNKKSHKDVTASQSRQILTEALYNTNMYGKNQKNTRPYNWILIHNARKHSSVILEVNHTKDNLEVVNWHFLSDDTLEQKKEQAINEGGLILTLESAAGNTNDDLSTHKDTPSTPNSQTEEVKNTQPEAPYTITPTTYTNKAGKTSNVFLITFAKELDAWEKKTITRITLERTNGKGSVTRGWRDKKTGGWIFRNEEDAIRAAQVVQIQEPETNSETETIEDSSTTNKTKEKDKINDADNNTNTKFAPDDKVQYSHDGGTTWTDAVVAEINSDGTYTIDTGLAPVMWVRATPNQLRPATNNSITQLPQFEEWITLSSQQRLPYMEAFPLTEEEIKNSTVDEILKANALRFLKGEKGMIATVSYINVFQNVRYPNRMAANDSSTTNSTQLDSPAHQNEQQMDVRNRREGGNENARVDRTNSQEGVSNEERPLHADKAGTRSATSGNGNGGSEQVPQREAVLQPGYSTSTEHSGGSVRSGDGRNVGGRTRRKSSSNSRTNSKRKVQTDNPRNEKYDRGLDLNDPLDKELNEALNEFDSLLNEFKKAGKRSLSMSVVGMNNEQIEMLPKLIVAGARAGFVVIKKGIRTFNMWASRMSKLVGQPLTDAGLSDNEIDAFIKEMWNSPYKLDGQEHTLKEWASILGQQELRKKVGTSLEEKRKQQLEAEPIAVIFGDAQNIAETLPFLLPKQQEDVLKAETQFFDESHNDQLHANGKGFMFTNGTGTGKTYTGLGIVKRFIKQGKGRVLIVTPSQQKVNDWIGDAKNLNIQLTSLDTAAKQNGTTATTEKGTGAVITTFANFRQNKALLEDTFDLVVYDESHRLLENKSGEQTAGVFQHHHICNRNKNSAFIRLQMINPLFKSLKEAQEDYAKKREKAVNELLKKYSQVSEHGLIRNGIPVPPPLDSTPDYKKDGFDDFYKDLENIAALRIKYHKEVEPRLQQEAEQAAKHTKVVFLSATPFNTIQNLDYAEGYIFTYPETGSGKIGPRSQFFLDHFGAAFKFRYGRLENSTKNADAIAKQEVAFSDYLQHQLQTMSGRIIDSPFDYSRDFPTVTLEKADEFNAAMEELANNPITSSGYYKVFGDYIYSNALFEVIKTAQSITRIKEHLKRGRKVVVFHRRMESEKNLQPPFALILTASQEAIEQDEHASAEEKREMLRQLAIIRSQLKSMLEWEQTLDLRMPRLQIADAFGADNVLFFSGKESKAAKDKAVKAFNNDDSGKNIIVIQESSGKEGISLHDTTGKHQRVLIILPLPQSPITALQIEGRIYRIGNKSNAIFEYPLLGLNSEMILFGQSFNARLGTTENLALGSQARDLRKSFTQGVEEHSGFIDYDNQGVGGKEFDATVQNDTNPFDAAVLDYYSNQKLTGRRNNRDGVDYYPTPEPLGYMMTQWGQIDEGESVLEPSAGHGAIARYVSRENRLTAIEPSQNLFAKLQFKAGGPGRTFENNIFENYNIHNKHDVILMNPPFGQGGRTAIDHLAKAFNHLEEGGRIVAIIPRGSADKKFDKWYLEQKDAALTAEIALPDITFQQAGTAVSCRVVVIDKITNTDLRHQAVNAALHYDISREKFEKIEDFFNEIRDIRVPGRTVDTKAKYQKKAKPTAREIKTIKGVQDVYLNEKGIIVSGRGIYESLYWEDKTGKDLLNSMMVKYNVLKASSERFEKIGMTNKSEVCDELKALACKLVDMSEEEMERAIEQRKSSNGAVLYREGENEEDLEAVNARFNEELSHYIKSGIIPDDGKFYLGYPSVELESSDFPYLPIFMRVSLMNKKAGMERHPFSPNDLYNLPKALKSPIAVFKYTRENMRNVIIDLTKNGKHFLVGITLDFDTGELHINSVSGLFPKENHEWIKWIQDDKSLGIYQEEKVQNLIESLRTNPEEAERIGLNLETISAKVSNVANKTKEKLKKYANSETSQHTEDNKFRQAQAAHPTSEAEVSEAANDAAQSLHLDNVTILSEEDLARLTPKQQRAKGWFDPKTGRIYINASNHANEADVVQTVLHEAVAHFGLRALFGKDFDTMLDRVYRSAGSEIHIPTHPLRVQQPGTANNRLLRQTHIRPQCQG